MSISTALLLQNLPLLRAKMEDHNEKAAWHALKYVESRQESHRNASLLHQALADCVKECVALLETDSSNVQPFAD